MGYTIMKLWPTEGFGTDVRLKGSNVSTFRSRQGEGGKPEGMAGGRRDQWRYRSNLWEQECLPWNRIHNPPREQRCSRKKVGPCFFLLFLFEICVCGEWSEVAQSMMTRVATRRESGIVVSVELETGRHSLSLFFFLFLLVTSWNSCVRVWWVGWSRW